MNLNLANALLQQATCDAAIVDLDMNGTTAHSLIETLVGAGA